MRKKTAFIFLFIFPSIVFGGGIDFIEAKNLANETESNLKSYDIQVLTKAQAIVAEKAFPYCINSTQSSPTNFTVVLKLNSNGKTINSWLRGDSKFAKCFHIQFSKTINYKPVQQPFYTSFEYTNTP